jgi:hypothetical protein
VDEDKVLAQNHDRDSCHRTTVCGPSANPPGQAASSDWLEKPGIRPGDRKFMARNFARCRRINKRIYQDGLPPKKQIPIGPFRVV